MKSGRIGNGERVKKKHFDLEAFKRGWNTVFDAARAAGALEPLSDEARTEPAIWVCARVKDLPDIPIESQKAECFRCGEAVWVDATYAARVFTDPKLMIGCMPCAMEMTNGLKDARSLSPGWDRYDGKKEK
jgi:hypothetical protein